MNSCLYACDVMHSRSEPVKNRFVYKVFMFYFDLDEIDAWAKKLWSVSHNRPNLFSFNDKDHLIFASPNPLPQGDRAHRNSYSAPSPASLREGAARPGEAKDSLKANILRFIRSKGVHQPIERVMLLTHLRMFGHMFNPVSFYYCFDGQGQPVCSVVEVCNTYREMKPYLLGAETWGKDHFQRRVAKNFYVSPFIDLDAEFDFRLKVPGENLQVLIDDYKDGHKVIVTALTGKRVPLTNGQLFFYMLRFPVITLQVLALIHWQAFVLWLKRVPHLRKADHRELQQEVYNVKHS